MKTTSFYNITLMISLILAIMGCEKSSDYNTEIDEQNIELSGIWIELTNGNDTIDFDGWNAETDVLILSRGFELRDGYWLPKYGSGPYEYLLKNGSIMLNNMFSSIANMKPYLFQINSTLDTFIIGNFYNTEIPSNQPIRFYKDQ